MCCSRAQPREKRGFEGVFLLVQETRRKLAHFRGGRRFLKKETQHIVWQQGKAADSVPDATGVDAVTEGEQKKKMKQPYY